MRSLILCIAVILTVACGKRTAESSRNSVVETSMAPSPMRYVEYPSQGVLLGQGWDAFRSAPANGVCVEFAELVVPGHEIDIRVDDIYSRDQLNEALRLSVSASYSGVGAQASGRVDYSNSLSVDRTKTNVMATVQVLKGDQFAGPISTQTSGKPTSFTTMRLNDAGRKALSSGADEFRKACGDSFVHHIKRGGRLNAYFSFDGLESKAKNALAIAISASGWGGSVSGQMNKEAEKNHWSKVTGIRVYQSGGPMQPTPMNGEQFNETVRQFLATSDPDLFPTKPFEIGLTRYDNLPDWKSNESMGDPERLSELIVFYWLFNDLRVQYENIILSASPSTRLIDQAANWASNEVYVMQGDALCTFKRVGTNWTLQVQDGCSQDKLATNPWLVPNVYLRADQLKSIAITLRNIIQQCMRATTEEARRTSCDRDRALTIYHQAYTSKLAKATADPEKFNNWKDAVDQEARTALLSTSLQSALTLGAIGPVFKAAKVTSESNKAKTTLPDEDQRKLLVSLKVEVLKDRVPKALLEQGRANMLDPLVAYFMSQNIKEGDQERFMLALVRQYYLASMLIPPAISRSDNSIAIGGVAVTPAPGPKTLEDALKVKQALRNQVIPEHIRFSASQCARKLESPLCQSANQITDLADELDFLPVLSVSEVARTETGSERRCRWVGPTWKYPGGHEECETVPISATYQELMTTFGGNRIDF